jgi:hypothetical protein
MKPVMVTRRNPHTGAKHDDCYFVLLGGQYIGRARQTDGEWNGSVWRGSVHREMMSLGGTWLEDHPE